MKVVDLDALGPSDAPLASGGQGKVYSLSVTPNFVAKVYKAGVDVDYTVLDRFPAAFATLDDQTRDRLAYPRNVISQDKTSPCGFVMQKIPDNHFFHAGGKRREQVLEHLLNGPEYARTLGVQFSPAELCRFLADFAQTLSGLHAKNIAVGDISPKNVLFTFKPAPRAFLIDCDSMAVNGARALQPAETPGWDAPGGIADPVTAAADDVYKFALVVLRSLVGDQDTRDPARLTAEVPAEIHALTRQSLQPVPSRRPPIDAWLDPLTRAAATASTSGQQGSRVGSPASGTYSFSPSPDTGLNQILDDLFTGTSSGPVSSYPNGRPPTPDRKFGVFAAIAAGLALVGAIVFLTSRSGDDRRTRSEPSTSAFPTSTVEASCDRFPTSPECTETSAISPASSPPADSSDCGYRTKLHLPDGSVYLNVAVGNTTPATHCNFAERVADAVVADAVVAAELGPVSVISPNTGQSYEMSCTEIAFESIAWRCDDDRTAVVYLYY